MSGQLGDVGAGGGKKKRTHPWRPCRDAKTYYLQGLGRGGRGTPGNRKKKKRSRRKKRRRGGLRGKEISIVLPCSATKWRTGATLGWEWTPSLGEYRSNAALPGEIAKSTSAVSCRKNSPCGSASSPTSARMNSGVPRQDAGGLAPYLFP